MSHPSKNLFDSDDIARAYHMRQWNESYRSTDAFAQFASDAISASSRVIDLGCGAGGATAHLATQFPTCAFHGIDYTESLVGLAKVEAKRRGVGNLQFSCADLYRLPRIDDCDGVVSLQTLSWLDAWEPAVDIVLQQLAPRWLAVSSLFYAGDITTSTLVQEHQRNRQHVVHTISLPAFDRRVRTLGYCTTRVQSFDIDVDLPKGDADVMGTYTLEVINVASTHKQRLQLSGPMLMPWSFVLVEKADA